WKIKFAVMKKIFFLICFLGFVFTVDAQLKGVLDRAKQRVKDKTTQKVNTTADNSVDSAFSKSEKAAKDVVKDITTKDSTKKKSSSNSDNDNNASSTNTPNGPVSFKAYSKYDFVPGEKIIGFEDFSTGNIGDFPGGWNTNGSGEIVTVEGKQGRWLWITRPGVFIPEFTKTYPDDFTIEFDLLHGTPFGGGWFSFVLAELTDFDNLQGWNTAPNTFRVGLYTATSGQNEGGIEMEIRKNFASMAAEQSASELLTDKYNPIHISIWRQKERIRIYLNEVKILDIPKAIATEAKPNSFFFPEKEADESHKYFIGNLRLAVGAPDTRNKMLTQNKWVTHGILFDVNSDRIKPESFGTLKEMANVLKEYSDLKVKIVGHTDADGKDADNLDLSKRRAASVKEALAKEFSIDASRMETDGKGESEPIDKNDNPAGKANNRRVEFIKI